MNLHLQAVSLCDGRLLVYAETHVDVFDCASGEWVQSINIRRTRPLDAKTGLLNLSMLQEMPHVTYLSNILKGGSANDSSLSFGILVISWVNFA